MAALTQVILTAKRISPAKADLSTPKMVVLETSKIAKVKPFKGGLSVLYGTGDRPYKKYRVAEKVAQYQTAVDPIGTGVVVVDSATAVAAGGTTQATAAALTKYYNVVTAAVPSASTGVKLPNVATLSLHGSDGSRGCVVIINSTSDTLSVFPASATHTMDGSSVTAATIAGFGRKHFVTSGSTAWVSVSAFA